MGTVLKQVVKLSNMFTWDASLFKPCVGPGIVSKWVSDTKCISK